MLTTAITVCSYTVCCMQYDWLLQQQLSFLFNKVHILYLSAFLGLRIEHLAMNSERRDSAAAMAMPLFQTQPPELVLPRSDRSSGSREAAVGGKVSASSSATSNVSGSDQNTVDGARRPVKSSSSTSMQNGQQIGAN